MLWPSSPQDAEAARAVHERIPEGQGRLLIRSMTLGNLAPGAQAWIERMEFDVELHLPGP